MTCKWLCKFLAFSLTWALFTLNLLWHFAPRRSPGRGSNSWCPLMVAVSDCHRAPCTHWVSLPLPDWWAKWLRRFFFFFLLSDVGFFYSLCYWWTFPNVMYVLMFRLQLRLVCNMLCMHQLRNCNVNNLFSPTTCFEISFSLHPSLSLFSLLSPLCLSQIKKQIAPLPCQMKTFCPSWQGKWIHRQ